MFEPTLRLGETGVPPMQCNLLTFFKEAPWVDDLKVQTRVHHFNSLN